MMEHRGVANTLPLIISDKKLSRFQAQRSILYNNTLSGSQAALPQNRCYFCCITKSILKIKVGLREVKILREYISARNLKKLISDAPGLVRKELVFAEGFLGIGFLLYPLNANPSEARVILSFQRALRHLE